MKNLEVKHKWLRISIFYNSVLWHKLIKDALLPLIDSLNNDKLISKFIISFSSDRGNHIKLSIEYKSDDEIVYRIEKHLGTYLTLHPSQHVQNNPTPVNLFMNLENNSYFYNLYLDPAVIENNRTKVLHYKFLISRYILKNLSDEEITPVEVLSTLVYLQLSIFKVVYPSRVRAQEASLKLIKYLKIKSNKNGALDSNGILEERIIAIFDNCPAILKQIGNEIWSEDISNTKISPLFFSNSGCYALHPNTLNRDFNLISRLIYEALGFNALNHRKVSINLLEVVFSII